MTTPEHTTASGPRRRPQRRRSTLGTTWSILVTVVAVVTIGLTIAAYTGLLGIRAITSSSMQPTLNAGDMIISRTIPAAEAETGDIATLQHPDGHVVTRRVLANEPDPEGPEDTGRLITMQGDDNDVADPRPYPATEVDVMLIRVPYLGGVFRAVSQPPVSYIALGSLALLLASGFMPARRRGDTASETTTEAAGKTADDAAKDRPAS